VVSQVHVTWVTTERVVSQSVGKSKLKATWPTTGAVEHGEDLYLASALPVSAEIGRAGNNQLSCARDAARASKIGMLDEPLDCIG
jgi:hypothetical protein